MKKILFLNLLLLYCFSSKANDEIVLNCPEQQHDRIENFVPFDMPNVYYDDVSQAITIDGDGAVNYYDVEIAPVTSSVPVITTQVSGYYDTIDVSSLPAAEYVITIYSPEDNTYEGFFEIL